MRSAIFCALLLTAALPQASAQPVGSFSADGETSAPDERAVRELTVPADRAAAAQLPVMWRGRIGAASVVLRAGFPSEGEDDIIAIEPNLALTVTRRDATRTFAVDLDDYRYFPCHHVGRAEPLEVSVFGGLRQPAGLLFSFHEHTCGVHASTDTEVMVAVDLTHPQPRAIVFGFDQYEMWGYANGGVVRSDATTHCTWNTGDFDCSEDHAFHSEWGDFHAARRYTAFGGDALPIRTAFSPRVSSLNELPALFRSGALTKSVFVDDVGVLRPVTRVMSGSRSIQILAEADEVDRLTATFYAVDEQRVTTARPRDLEEEEETQPAVGDDEETPRPITRTSDIATFRPSVLHARGTTQLLQIVMEIGLQRSLFWLAVDPYDRERPIAALRVASTAEEGQNRGKKIPTSLMTFRFADSGAVVEAANSWIDDVFTGARCWLEDPDEEPPGVLVGAIAWSTSGFDVVLTPRPEDARRVRVAISPDGKLSTEPLMDEEGTH